MITACGIADNKELSFEERLIQHKSKYAGDASKLINLSNLLDFSYYEAKYELKDKNIIINYNIPLTLSEIDIESMQRGVLYNSTLTFALIENAESITFNFTPTKDNNDVHIISYAIKRKDIEDLYHEDVKTFSKNKQSLVKAINRAKSIDKSSMDNFFKSVQ